MELDRIRNTVNAALDPKSPITWDDVTYAVEVSIHRAHTRRTRGRYLTEASWTRLCDEREAQGLPRDRFTDAGQRRIAEILAMHAEGRR